MKTISLPFARFLLTIEMAAGSCFLASFPSSTAPATSTLPPLTAAPANLPPLARTKPGKFHVVALPAHFTACGINNKGEVAGTWLLAPILHIPTAETRAALWRKGTLRVLPQWNQEPSYGAALNDASVVAGGAGSTSTGAYSVWTGDAVVWQSDAKKPYPKLFGHLPDLSLAEAHAINGRGYVVGSSQPSSIQERGPELSVENVSKTIFAFFSDGRQMIDLGYGTAYGINERGQITGTSNGRIVLWQENEVRLLGQGEGRAINNRGQIAGISAFKRARPHAMLWERGVIKDLGVLPHTIESEAASINDRGQIVGNCSDHYDDKKQRAFLWQSGVMYDLNALISRKPGWILREARSINNRGQIVSVGGLHGKERSYLLTPQ